MLIHKFIHILISLKYRLCPKFSGGKDGWAYLLKEKTQVNYTKNYTKDTSELHKTLHKKDTRNYTIHLKREGTSHLYL